MQRKKNSAHTPYPTTALKIVVHTYLGGDGVHGAKKRGLFVERVTVERHEHGRHVDGVLADENRRRWVEHRVPTCNFKQGTHRENGER